MPRGPQFRRVTSRQNPLVARCRALIHDSPPDVVLIEGPTLVGEAFASGWTPDVVVVTDAAREDPAVARVLHSLPHATDCVVTTTAVMSAMSPVRTPSGMLAIAAVPPSSVPQLGTDPARGTVPTRGTVPAIPLVVCAVDVQDPGNLGAILRVAEAAGATGAWAAGRSADPYGWKALRGSMGSAFRLPVIRRIGVDEALDRVRTAGWQTVATVLDGVAPETVDLTTPTCVFLGAEGAGLPASIVDAADVGLAIPMEAPVASLNVAVAAAIVLYEARRQRRATGPRGRA